MRQDSVIYLRTTAQTDHPDYFGSLSISTLKESIWEPVITDDAAKFS
jgi:hypothetical protein